MLRPVRYLLHRRLITVHQVPIRLVEITDILNTIEHIGDSIRFKNGCPKRIVCTILIHILNPKLHGFILLGFHFLRFLQFLVRLLNLRLLVLNILGKCFLFCKQLVQLVGRRLKFCNIRSLIVLDIRNLVIGLL